jgi:hypothetical protein
LINLFKVTEMSCGNEFKGRNSHKEKTNVPLSLIIKYLKINYVCQPMQNTKLWGLGCIKIYGYVHSQHSADSTMRNEMAV